ncbi:MAG: hypothetical protein ACKPCI_07805, partial [Dolichospermum sp.]
LLWNGHWQHSDNELNYKSPPNRRFTALTDVMRYKVTPPPTPSPLFERGLNMYLIRAETPVKYN